MRKVATLILALLAASSVAQKIEIPRDDSPRGQTRAAAQVHFIAEPQSITANRADMLTLRIHVDPGFHINSHKPKGHDETLVPTKLAVEETDNLKVSEVDFPPGEPYHFAFDPKLTLDVYSGDVVLTAHVHAKPGDGTLRGALHYQACDQAACYPPQLLKIEQPFSARLPVKAPTGPIAQPTSVVK